MGGDELAKCRVLASHHPENDSRIGIYGRGDLLSSPITAIRVFRIRLAFCRPFLSRQDQP